MPNTLKLKEVYERMLAKTKESKSELDRLDSDNPLGSMLARAQLGAVGLDGRFAHLEVIAAAETFRVCSESKRPSVEKQYSSLITSFVYSICNSERRKKLMQRDDFRIIFKDSVYKMMGIDSSEAFDSEQAALLCEVLNKELQMPSPGLHKKMLETMISRYADTPEYSFKPGCSSLASACYVVAEAADLTLSRETMVKLINGANFPASFLQRGSQNPHRIAALAKLDRREEPAQATEMGHSI